MLFFKGFILNTNFDPYAFHIFSYPFEVIRELELSDEYIDIQRSKQLPRII